jgi:hypothetical protein
MNTTNIIFPRLKSIHSQALALSFLGIQGLRLMRSLSKTGFNNTEKLKYYLGLIGSENVEIDVYKEKMIDLLMEFKSRSERYGSLPLTRPFILAVNGGLLSRSISKVMTMIHNFIGLVELEVCTINQRDLKNTTPMTIRCPSLKALHFRDFDDFDGSKLTFFL